MGCGFVATSLTRAPALRRSASLTEALAVADQKTDAPLKIHEDREVGQGAFRRGITRLR